MLLQQVDLSHVLLQGRRWSSSLLKTPHRLTISQKKKKKGGGCPSYARHIYPPPPNTLTHCQHSDSHQICCNMTVHVFTPLRGQHGTASKRHFGKLAVPRGTCSPPHPVFPDVSMTHWGNNAPPLLSLGPSLPPSCKPGLSHGNTLPLPLTFLKRGCVRPTFPPKQGTRPLILCRIYMSTRTCLKPPTGRHPAVANFLCHKSGLIGWP